MYDEIFNIDRFSSIHSNPFLSAIFFLKNKLVINGSPFLRVYFSMTCLLVQCVPCTVVQLQWTMNLLYFVVIYACKINWVLATILDTMYIDPCFTVQCTIISFDRKQASIGFTEALSKNQNSQIMINPKNKNSIIYESTLDNLII